MSEITTVSGYHFPTQDITHKPRRLQSDNIKQSDRWADAPKEDEAIDPTTCVPLHGVTVERAIQYYEANAKGEYATLYNSTAKWLRQLLAVGKLNAIKAEQELQKSEVVVNEAKTNEVSEST